VNSRGKEILVNDTSPAPAGDAERLELVAHEVLDGYMKRRGVTVRGLAETVGVNRCTIDRLRRGAQKRVEEPVAKGIERELNAPDGAIFVAPAPTCDSRRIGSRKSNGKALAA
jgi:transcriptional regulator with XRE-family HTH domain